MKKLIAIAALTASTLATANPNHFHGHRHFGHHHRPHVIHHHHGSHHWVAPLIIGGIIGAAVTANRVEAQTQAPVVVVPQTAPVIVTEQGQQIVTCPPGTYPFEFKGWVRNAFGQFVETTYIKCQ